MPLQILNVPNPNAEIGRGLGAGVGQGLASILDQFAKTKINQLTARSQENKLTNAYEGLGYSKEEARSIAALPEKAQIQFLKEYGPREQQQMVQPQNLIEDIQNLEQPAQEINHEGILGALTSLQPKNLQQEMAVKQGEQFLTPEQNQEAMSRFIQEALSKQQPGAPKITPKAAQIPTTSKEKPAPLKVAQQPERRLSKTELAAQHKEQQALAKEERVRAHTEEAAAQKETQKLYNETVGNYKAAKQSDKRIERFDKLIEGGNLSWPVWSSFTKAVTKGLFGFGMDLSAMTTADTQEFDKLSSEYIRDIKNVFGGGRITDQDLQAYMKTIPTSTMSEAGKKRVIENHKYMNKAAEVRYEVMQKIIKDNGGKRPADLEVQIEEKASPKLDELADKFSKNMEALGKIQTKQAKEVSEISDWEKAKRLLGY